MSWINEGPSWKLGVLAFFVTSLSFPSVTIQDEQDEMLRGMEIGHDLLAVAASLTTWPRIEMLSYRPGE